MAGFDDLIRRTLEKQGDPTPERRAAIYQSSRQALERMLSTNTALDDAAAAVQRDRLETAIAAIEADYRTTDATIPPAAPTPTPAPNPAPMPRTKPVSASPPPAPIPAPEQKAAPEVSINVAPGREVPPVPTPPASSSETGVATVGNEPRFTEEGDEEPAVTRLEDYTEMYRGDVLRERKPYAKMLLWTIILVGIAVAVWWAITFGPALLKKQLDGSVPNPVSPIQSGAFSPEGQDGWVTAFLPSEDSQNIETEGRGTADIFQEGNTSFLRMTSNAGSTANTIKIKMPRGVMQSIRGKAATFELMIKSPQEGAHQFAVFCEFAAMGDCGRKRFRVSQKAEAFIFDVLVNDAELPRDDEAYLALHTDLASVGKSIDLYSIRLRTED